jgi:hypothetical protein
MSDLKDIKATTLQLRLEAVRESVNRARSAFIIATVTSLLIIMPAWNAYLSWYRVFAMRVEPYAQSGTSVVDEAQKQVVAEWVKNQTITTGILGIRVGISDAAVVGALGLYVVSIWLYFSLRRANRTIGYLLQDVMNESYEVQQMIFHGIAARLVFSDIGRGDQPVRYLNQQPVAKNFLFVRRVVKGLFFLPAATIFFIVSMDLLSIFLLRAPFRPGHPILYTAIQSQSYPDRLATWIQIIGWESLALLLGFLTARLCFRGVEFETATEDILKEYSHHLGRIDADARSDEAKEAE